MNTLTFPKTIESITQFANQSYASQGSRLRVQVTEVNFPQIKLKTDLPGVEFILDFLGNNKWNIRGTITLEGAIVKDTYISWVNEKVQLLNYCILHDPNSKSVVHRDQTYEPEFSGLLFHSGCIGPLWLWLHSFTVEDNIRPMLQPLFYKVKHSDGPLAMLPFHKEFRFSDIEELASYYDLNENQKEKVYRLFEKEYRYPCAVIKEIHKVIQNG